METVKTSVIVLRNPWAGHRSTVTVDITRGGPSALGSQYNGQVQEDFRENVISMPDLASACECQRVGVRSRWKGHTHQRKQRSMKGEGELRGR